MEYLNRGLSRKKQSYVLSIFLLQLQETALGMFAISNQTCCNGVLGYAGPDNQMPCAEMRCCNLDEIVALQRVNHAFGFCFRCVVRYVQSVHNAFNVVKLYKDLFVILYNIMQHTYEYASFYTNSCFQIFIINKFYHK